MELAHNASGLEMQTPDEQKAKSTSSHIKINAVLVNKCWGFCSILLSSLSASKFGK